VADVRFAPLDIRAESLADLVYDAIRQSIMNKALPPGSRVSENGLARQLGVSKTPVREAMLKLRQIGVIESDGLRGGRVVRPSRTKIRQAYEIREALEVFAVRTVTARVTGTELERICEVAAESLECAHGGDQAGFRKHDFTFHRSIADGAANPRLAEMIDDVFTLIVTLRQRDFPNVAASVECGIAHIRIADAITRRDTEGAEAAAREHIRQVEGYVLAGPGIGEPG
jgi:DNA-binding GntR family transcriptional regulator